MTARNGMALFCLCSGLWSLPARAIDIRTLPVGNPANAGEWSGESYGGTGPDRICGAVDYEYRIGKYEVTVGQYVTFLNAVAKSDPYGLYNTNMALWFGIERSGYSGSYSYIIVAAWLYRPVTFVSYWDACRFANWLHNGQPTGAQGPGTTETGAYTLNGYIGGDGRSIQRNAEAKWAIPSEDEWYKAAYHKNDGVTGNYFDYPTSSDVIPSNDLIDPDPGNNATFYHITYTSGSPYYWTQIGAHENSDSPYGTFDQGGNVSEWNETVVYDLSGEAHRGLRGGSFYKGFDGTDLHASFRDHKNPMFEGLAVGFRVFAVPSDADADADADGVDNRYDHCPDTVPGSEVNADGCPQFIAGDFDLDGDVDGLDVGAFAACGSGPAGSIFARCEIMDFDNDSDVDQEDFGIFQACISGESVPGDPACLPRFGMALIPAGEFQMGNSFSGEGQSDELPRHTASLDAFYIDRYEVTTYHYRDALDWAQSQGLVYVGDGSVGSGTIFGTDNDQPYCNVISVDGIQCNDDGAFSIMPDRVNHPMVSVTWYGAAAYANWRSQREGREPCYTLSGAWMCDFSKNGYRLPTEAEWEKAARGGADGHRFPWSDQDTVQHSRANYYSQSSYLYDTSPTRGHHPVWNGTYISTSPVAFFDGTLRQKTDFNWPGDATSYQTADGANGYRLYDIAGNVMEWCNDWYDAGYYSASPCANPRGPTSGTVRVLRGGTYTRSADYCRVARRAKTFPDVRGYTGGFRLVLSAP